MSLSFQTWRRFSRLPSVGVGEEQATGGVGMEDRGQDGAGAERGRPPLCIKSNFAIVEFAGQS